MAPAAAGHACMDGAWAWASGMGHAASQLPHIPNHQSYDKHLAPLSPQQGPSPRLSLVFLDPHAVLSPVETAREGGSIGGLEPNATLNYTPTCDFISSSTRLYHAHDEPTRYRARKSSNKTFYEKRAS